MKTLHTHSLIALAGLALAGCYGSTEEGAGGATLGLVEEAPLPLVARDAWMQAPAGCEDRLGDVATFGVAEGEPALVVALSVNGEMLCVDALEAVDLELRDEGDDPAADDLCRRYLTVIDDTAGTRRETSSSGPAHTTTGRPREGDPSPQPNIGATVTVDKADPSPQPNFELGANDEGKDSTTAEPGGSSGSSTTTNTTTTTPRREGDPSPQPNSQAMQAPAPAAASSE
jgi:hypothetical protein